MPISQQDAVKMMRRASNEIKSLRREIDALAPRADAYETIRRMVGLIAGPAGGGYASEDMTWVLDKEAERLEAELAAEADMRSGTRPEANLD